MTTEDLTPERAEDQERSDEPGPAMWPCPTGHPGPHLDFARATVDVAKVIADARAEGYRAGREDAVPPEHVADAAARLRQDIREAIEVCYGELGGEADTPEDVAGSERAIAHDMATVLDWIARGLQPQETATSQERA